MKYIALFRGINVGGKNKVKMEDLKKMLQNLGFRETKTYIQSGNVIFKTEMEEKAIEEKIQTQLFCEFSIESKVLIRNKIEFEHFYEKNPISKKEMESAEEMDKTIEHMYAYFLKEEPDITFLEHMKEIYGNQGIVALGKKELYVLFFESIRTSRLAKQLDKSFPDATVRNWNTTTKLYALVKNQNEK